VDHTLAAASSKASSRRRSVLDLAPLELDCMNTLWPMGQGTVREIRDRLAERRPRAYTTIMTIMDRLARKGVVERRKSGHAYIYVPTLSAQVARTHALSQVVESFFGGSKEALLAELGATVTPQRARAAVAGAGAGSVVVFPSAPSASADATSVRETSTAVPAAVYDISTHESSDADTSEAATNYFEAVERIDDTLL
jgi:BlaI family penicillinase repressor